MLALTVHPEMAFAVTHLDKKIENRNWYSHAVLGKYICLHAGKNLGGRPGPMAHKAGIEVLVASARRAGWVVETIATSDGKDAIVRFSKEGHRSSCVDVDRKCPMEAGAIVAVVEVVDIVTGSQKPWAIPGMRHWRLGDVLVLKDPVRCDGKQGVWEVEEYDALDVRRQVGRIVDFAERGRR